MTQKRIYKDLNNYMKNIKLLGLMSLLFVVSMQKLSANTALQVTNSAPKPAVTTQMQQPVTSVASSGKAQQSLTKLQSPMRPAVQSGWGSPATRPAVQPMQGQVSVAFQQQIDAQRKSLQEQLKNPAVESHRLAEANLVKAQEEESKAREATRKASQDLSKAVSAQEVRGFLNAERDYYNSLQRASVMVRSFDYATFIDSNGKAQPGNEFFGWRKIANPSLGVEISFSARALNDLHIGLQLDNESWVEFVVGGWDNTRSQIRLCTAANPRPSTGDTPAGLGKIPRPDKFFDYKLIVKADGTYTLHASSVVSAEQILIVQGSRPEFKERKIQAYSFKSFNRSISIFAPLVASSGDKNSVTVSSGVQQESLQKESDNKALPVATPTTIPAPALPPVPALPPAPASAPVPVPVPAPVAVPAPESTELKALSLIK